MSGVDDPPDHPSRGVDQEQASEGGPEERPLTIDDVPRLGSGAGIAVGCGLLVVVIAVTFWVVRGWLLH